VFLKLKFNSDEQRGTKNFVNPASKEVKIP